MSKHATERGARPRTMLRVVVTAVVVSGLMLIPAPDAADPTAAGTAGPTVTGAARAADPAAAPRLTLLSSPRPDRVSDGNVLLAVSAPGADQVTVRLNGTPVTDRFAPQDGRLVGLVDGLRDGINVLTLTARGPRPGVDVLTVRNAPRRGPMFSGPQQQPFVCQTEAFTTIAGPPLGPATDAACSAPTRVDYLYRSTTDRRLKPLPDRSARPADLATVRTSTGAQVPYVVRVETGVINRSICRRSVVDR